MSKNESNPLIENDLFEHCSLIEAGEKESVRCGIEPAREAQELEAALVNIELSPTRSPSRQFPVEQSYLSVNQVAIRYGVSRATIWRWVKSEQIPPPVKFSDRVTRWSLQRLLSHEQMIENGAPQ